VIGDELMGELGDCNDEHEVEEELEPGGTALLECVARGSQAGRN
jgi:hypothetical protein